MIQKVFDTLMYLGDLLIIHSPSWLPLASDFIARCSRARVIQGTIIQKQGGAKGLAPSFYRSRQIKKKA